MTYRTGEYVLGPWGSEEEIRDRSACALGLVRKDEKSQWSVDLSLGESMSSISVGYFRLLSYGVRTRAGLTLTTSTGLGVSLSADRKVTKHSRLGMGVETSTLGGVTFRLR
jgi:DnaJ family protein C protein 11